MPISGHDKHCFPLISLDSNCSVLTQSLRWCLPPLSHLLSGSETDQSRKGQDPEQPGRQWSTRTNTAIWRGCQRLSPGRERVHRCTVRESHGSQVHKATQRQQKQRKINVGFWEVERHRKMRSLIIKMRIHNQDLNELQEYKQRREPK